MTTRNTAKVIPSIGPAAAVLLAASLLLTAFTWANDLDVTTGLERTDASGRIVDTGRMPVSGAEVFLYYMHCVNGFHNRLAGKTLTREDGSFRFEQAIVWEPRRQDERDFRPEYNLIARHTRHGIDFAILLPDDATDNITIILRGPNPVEARVRDEWGRPIPAARVFLAGGSHPDVMQEESPPVHGGFYIHDDLGISSGLTDEEGRVTLIGPQHPTFRAEKDGYLTAMSFRARDIVLLPSARIEGTVTLEGGAPAANVGVKYEYYGEAITSTRGTVTDEDGHYHFANVLASGSYPPSRGNFRKGMENITKKGYGKLRPISLCPSSPFLAASEIVRPELGNTLVKDLILNKACIVSGKVIELDTGRLVPNIRLSMGVTIRQQDREWLEVNSNQSGDFRFVVIPGSAVSLMCREPRRIGDYLIDEQWSQANRFSFEGVVENDITDLEIPIALVPMVELTGRVVDAEEAGVAAAKVYINSTMPGRKTDRTGGFTLRAPISGQDFDLFAIDRTKRFASLVHLKAGTTEPTLTLKPMRNYEGRVSNKGVLPAGDLEFNLDLYINNSSLDEVRQKLHTNKKDGTFFVENLCPEATYYASWSSDSRKNREYDYGNATIDLAELEPGTPIFFEATQYLNTITGRVLNEQGEPVRRARVEVHPSEMRASDAPLSGNITDDNGWFSINMLALGEVDLHVDAAGYTPLSSRAPTDTDDFEAILKRSGDGNFLLRPSRGP